MDKLKYTNDLIYTSSPDSYVPPFTLPVVCSYERWLIEIKSLKCNEAKLNHNHFSFRPKDWYPMIYDPIFSTYGVEDLVFHLSLMNGKWGVSGLSVTPWQEQLKCCACRWLFRPCWVHELPSGLIDPHPGECGAGDPSALVAAAWGMCSCHHLRPAAWLWLLPHHHQ